MSAGALPGTTPATFAPALPTGFAASEGEFGVSMSDLTEVPANQLTYGGDAAFGVLGNGHFGLVQNLDVEWTDPGGGPSELDRVVLLFDVFSQVGGSAAFQTQLVPAGQSDGDFRLATFITGTDVPYDRTGAPVGFVTEDVPFDTLPDTYADAPLRAFSFGTLTHGATAEFTIAFDLGVVAGAVVGAGISEPLYDPNDGSEPVVELTFEQVNTGGFSSFTETTMAPDPPAGYSLGGATTPVYYDITTTAAFTGDVEVCVHYDPADFSDEENVRLLHYEGGAWTDITDLPVNTDGDIVCGTTSSFSPFAVVQDLVQTALDLSVEIDSLPLEDFLAPNAKAAANRRRVLANRVLEAAAAIAADDSSGALGRIGSVLDRMDGLTAPPDWVLPSTQLEVLRFELMGLEHLLGLE